jgi:hypothetical protein
MRIGVRLLAADAVFDGVAGLILDREQARILRPQLSSATRPLTTNTTSASGKTTRETAAE